MNWLQGSHVLELTVDKGGDGIGRSWLQTLCVDISRQGRWQGRANSGRNVVLLLLNAVVFFRDGVQCC
jgi:hypothetical protein